MSDLADDVWTAGYEAGRREVKAEHAQRMRDLQVAEETLLETAHAAEVESPDDGVSPYWLRVRAERYRREQWEAARIARETAPDA